MSSNNFIRAASANLHRALKQKAPAPQANLARAMQRRIAAQRGAHYEIKLPQGVPASDHGLKGGLDQASTAVQSYTAKPGPTMVRWHSMLF